MGKRKRKGRNNSSEHKVLWIQALKNEPSVEQCENTTDALHHTVCDLTIIVTRVQLTESQSIPTNSISKTQLQDDSNIVEAKRYSDSNISICLHSSAIGPITLLESMARHVKNYKPLPNGDCGDGIVNPYDKKEVLNKYWAQRHKLFSKFDKGIQLDPESWYSVTPEKIAQHIARRVYECWENDSSSIAGTKSISELSDSKETPKRIIIDAFCGCGGNTIAFATNENATVIAIDHDRKKIQNAISNCAIYGIPPSRVIFIEGDVNHVLGHYKDGIKMPHEPECFPLTKMETCLGYTIGSCDHLPESIDSLFLSPPWGGPSYFEKDSFTLKDITINSDKLALQNIYDGVDLLSAALRASKSIMLFLPRNIDGETLGKDAISVGYHGHIELEQQILEGKLKTVTAYLSRSHNSPIN